MHFGCPLVVCWFSLENAYCNDPIKSETLVLSVSQKVLLSPAPPKSSNWPPFCDPLTGITQFNSATKWVWGDYCLASFGNSKQPSLNIYKGFLGIPIPSVSKKRQGSAEEETEERGLSFTFELPNKTTKVQRGRSKGGHTGSEGQGFEVLKVKFYQHPWLFCGWDNS